MLCAVDWCPDAAVVFIAGVSEVQPVDELNAADSPLEVPVCRTHWVDAGRWSEGRLRATRLAPRRTTRTGAQDAA